MSDRAEFTAQGIEAAADTIERTLPSIQAAMEQQGLKHLTPAEVVEVIRGAFVGTLRELAAETRKL